MNPNMLALDMTDVFVFYATLILLIVCLAYMQIRHNSHIFRSRTFTGQLLGTRMIKYCGQSWHQES